MAHASSSLTVALTPRGSRIADGAMPPPPAPPALVLLAFVLAADTRLRLPLGALLPELPDPPPPRCDVLAAGLPAEAALPPTPTPPLRHCELRAEEALEAAVAILRVYCS